MFNDSSRPAEAGDKRPQWGFECVSGNCLPRHYELYYRPVSTKMLFVIDVIFKKKKKRNRLAVVYRDWIVELGLFDIGANQRSYFGSKV